MCKEFQIFKAMSEDERAWVKELVGRFGWMVRVAIWQVHYFGICRMCVFDYKNNTLVMNA